jgi:SPP1 family predicted phage head-tail adaptor
MPIIRGGAGELRYRVKFEAPDQVTDDYGNVTTGWVDKFTVSANITPRLGGETIDAARLAGRQPAIIRVRQSNDTRQIKTDWRCTKMSDGTVYNVRSVVDPAQGDVEHGKYFDMLAETGVAI